jgi:CRISPR-associated protein Cmr5
MKKLIPYLVKADAHLRAEREKRLSNQSSDHNSLFNQKGEIQGEYPPFAASFGAAIIRSGLLPAVFLFAEKSGGGKDKEPLTRLMLEMLKQPGDSDTRLHEYVLNRQDAEGPRLRQRILDASIAAKLALRTFPVANKTKPS